MLVTPTLRLASLGETNVEGDGRAIDLIIIRSDSTLP